MDLERLAQQAFQLFPAPSGDGPQAIRPLPGLRLLRHHRPTAFEGSIYEPVICLIAAGRKETTFGGRTFGMSAGHCLLISHDLPVRSRITRAPYLALLLDVDLGLLRSVHAEVGDAAPRGEDARALEVHQAAPPLVEALHRFLTVASSPVDARVLGPAIVRELHYRLLMAPFGGMLRGLIRHDSQASAITRAIAHIRRDFREPITIPLLAREVGMSAPSFHKHFKAVTASTPLQYQKELRLLEARRLLRAGEASVSAAAFGVGYESPHQFSREYARKFGVPPSKDLVRVQGAGLR